jgi:hypothetical protein
MNTVKQGFRSTTTRAAIVLTVGAMLAFAGISLAGGGGPKLSVETFNLPGQTTNGANPKCPKGQRVLSGGAVQAGGPVNLYVHASSPLDTGRGWSIAMRNSDFPANSQTVTAMAICSSQRTHMNLTRFNVAPGDADGATLACDRGERAVGGGVLPVNAPVHNFFVKASGPLNASGDRLNLDDGDRPVKWFAEITNQSAQGTGQALVAVWVVCLPNSNAKIEASQFQADPGEDGEAKASCGRRRTALGGGVMPVDNPRTANVEASGPLAASPFVEDVRDGSKPKAWYGAAENFAGDPGRIFKVIAVCE